MMLRFSGRAAVPGRWLVDRGPPRTRTRTCPSPSPSPGPSPGPSPSTGPSPGPSPSTITSLTTTITSLSTRSSHTSASLQAKNLLYRLVNKSKKKNWYESPPLKPTILDLPKKKYVESHRSKILNSILFKAVSDLLTTAQLSNEIQSLGPEISKVALARDFSSCRVFWKSHGDADRDDRTQKALEKSASQIRYFITSQQIMGGVPPIVFLRDRRLAAIAEVDQLLQNADFGPDPPEDSDEDRVTAADEVATALQSPQPILYGIDHTLLNKQIADWRQKSKKEEHSQSDELQEAQLAAIAAHKKQQIINKRKRKAPTRDDDITPREFLLAQQAEATPRGRSQIRTKEEEEEEEPEESRTFKDAGLRELASLEGKTNSS